MSVVKRASPDASENVRKGALRVKTNTPTLMDPFPRAREICGLLCLSDPYFSGTKWKRRVAIP